MCSIKDGFKLCTCDADNLPSEEIDWWLKRINPELPLQYRKGKVKLASFTQKEEEEKQFIQNELNTRNCFDFDYNPQEDDWLRLRKYAYRYQNGSWQVDSSNGLAPWRTQLENYETGKID